MLSKQVFIIAARLLAVAVNCSPLRCEPQGAVTESVSIIKADPHHENTLLAGTSTALLFRSRDRGDSWDRVQFPGERRSTLHALMIDPTRINVYFVGVTSEKVEYAGLFRSSDEGAHWEQVPDLREKQVWSLASWEPDSRIMAAGTEEGVFLSKDGGENWTHISPARYAGPQPVVSLAFDPHRRNIIYAGTPHLAWKTIDGGANWRPIHHGMQEDSDIFSIDVDRTMPKRLFAGACTGVYRSLDGGTTWSNLERFLGAQFRTYVVTHAPNSANALFAGTRDGLFLSPDGGATWKTLSRKIVRSVAFDPFDPRRVFVASDQGILRSDDGGHHFTTVNQGLQDHSSILK